MLYFPSPQPGVSRVALLCAGEQTQVQFHNSLTKTESPSQRHLTASMNICSSTDTVTYNRSFQGQMRDKQKLPGTCLGNFSFIWGPPKSRLWDKDLSSWNLFGRCKKIAVEEWESKAGKAANTGRVIQHIITVGAWNQIPRELSMQCSTHMSFPVPGTRELGYWYPNTHQSQLEGCSQGAWIPWKVATCRWQRSAGASSWKLGCSASRQ